MAEVFPICGVILRRSEAEPKDLLFAFVSERQIDRKQIKLQVEA